MRKRERKIESNKKKVEKEALGDGGKQRKEERYNKWERKNMKREKTENSICKRMRERKRDRTERKSRERHKKKVYKREEGKTERKKQAIREMKERKRERGE
jgi:hypothetical protein